LAGFALSGMTTEPPMKQPGLQFPPLHTSAVPQPVPSDAFVHPEVLVAGWQLWQASVGLGAALAYAVPPMTHAPPPASPVLEVELLPELLPELALEEPLWEPEALDAFPSAFPELALVEPSAMASLPASGLASVRLPRPAMAWHAVREEKQSAAARARVIEVVIRSSLPRRSRRRPA
jgi:hypothetical protein